MQTFGYHGVHMLPFCSSAYKGFPMTRLLKLNSMLPDEAVYDIMGSPVGQLCMIASDTGLHHILWEHEINMERGKAFLQRVKRMPEHNILTATKLQLTEYFAGERQQFSIPLRPSGTIFQLRVWQELSKISYGETISYGEQAHRIGDKKKARAVGRANGLNPISIIVPCHRVIGGSGHLTGFGGGLSSKAFLLELERKVLNNHIGVPE